MDKFAWVIAAFFAVALVFPPLVLYIIGGFVILTGLVIAYYLRGILLRIGIVAVPLSAVAWAVTSIQIPSVTFPSVSVPAFHVPRFVLPTVPIAVIQTILFIVLVGAVMLALLFGTRALRGFIDGYLEGRAGPTGTYFVREELREEMEQHEPEPAPQTRSTATKPQLPDPEPESEKEEDPYGNIEPLLPD